MNEQASEGLNQESVTWAKLDAVLQSYIDRGKVAGLVYLIQRGGECVHSAARGLMNVASGEAMQPDTIFRIFSMTKPVTAVATMMLVEDGLLSLADPVSSYIPAFDDFRVLADPANPTGELVPLARSITVADLLTHRSGLPSAVFEDAPIETIYRAAGLWELSLPEMIQKLVTLPLEFQPGSAWHYGLSYEVLGYLVQTVSEVPFEQFVQSRLLQPLRMADTGFYIPESKHHRLAIAYNHPADGALLPFDTLKTRAMVTEGFPPFGGCGMVSTAPDYLRFMQILHHGGTLDGLRLLSPETVAGMTTNHIPEALRPINVGDFVLAGAGYGLGLGLCLEQAEWLGGMRLGSYFWLGSMGTHAWVDPVNDLIAVFMTQSQAYMEPAIVFQSLVYQALG